MLSRTSGPREIREQGKLKNREVSHFYSSPTLLVICYTRQKGWDMRHTWARYELHACIHHGKPIFDAMIILTWISSKWGVDWICLP
jgi:hypothetical protein